MPEQRNPKASPATKKSNARTGSKKMKMSEMKNQPSEIAASRKKNQEIIEKAEKLRSKMHISEEVKLLCIERLHPHNKAFKEDKRRSKVLKSRLPSLSTRLEATETLYSSASFRFHLLAREALAPIIAAMFFDDDLPVAKVTLKLKKSKHLSSVHKKHNPKADLKRFRRFLRKVFGGCLDGYFFGALEYAPDGDYIIVHIHLLVAGDCLQALKTAKKTGGNNFDIYIKDLGGDDPENPRPGHTRECIKAEIGFIDYMLKGATYSKAYHFGSGELYSCPPDPDVEIALLRQRNRHSLSNYVIFGGLPELGAVFGRKSDILNDRSQKAEKVKNGKNIYKNKLGVRLKASMCDQAGGRLASVEINDVRDLTCQTMSEIVKHRNAFSKVGISNLMRVSKGRLDLASDVYLIKLKDQSIKMFQHERVSGPNGLLSALVDVGVNALKSGTRNEILSAFEGLQFSFDVQQIERAGVTKHGSTGNFLYHLPDGKVIGKPSKEFNSLPVDNELGISLTANGKFSDWEKIVAPIVRGKPASLAIMGQSLLPIFRTLKGTKVSSVQQATLMLFGETSKGKSTFANALGAALWHDPTAVQSLYQTTNNIMASLKSYSGIAMVLDEATLVDETEASRKQKIATLIHGIAAGQDKGRMTSKHRVQSKQILTAILSSNESGKALQVSSKAVAGGVDVRNPCLSFDEIDFVFNIIDEDTGATMKALRDASESHYGLLGPMVAAALCRSLDTNSEKTIEQLDIYFDNFRDWLKKRVENEDDVNEGAAFRLGEQFAGMYSVLRFAQLVGILPRSKWGDFLLPLKKACLSVLREAGLFGIKKRKKATLKSKQSEISERIQYLYERNKDRVRFLEDGYEILPDKESKRLVFTGYFQKDGFYFVAVQTKKLLMKVLKGCADADLKELQKIGMFHGTNSSHKGNFAVRLGSNGKKKYDGCYILKFKIPPIKR